MAFSHPNVLMASFVGRVKAGDPSAVAGLRALVHRHHHGDPQATAMLGRLARAMRGGLASGQSYMGQSYMGFALPHALTGLVANVAHLSGHIVGTAARVLEQTGVIAGNVLHKTGTIAAKPFRFAESKLGGNKPVHFLPPHVAVPPH